MVSALSRLVAPMMPVLTAIGFAMVALCVGVVAHAEGRFSLDPPKTLSASPQLLMLVGMATEPVVPEADAAIPIRDATGQALGPLLTDGQFCELAAAGSGVIGEATYQVVGTAREPQANCRRHFSRLARKMPVAAGALGRSVFQKLDAPHGLGAERFRLIPWRSVFASRFPIGTVLFIPALRDLIIDGGPRHDGYVFVADRLGDAPLGQLSLVVDRQHLRIAMPNGEVAGYQVDDPSIASQLRRAHTLR